MNKCDIIIPIYNAYDCLKPCIDSVIKNTDLDNNRLILIDDKSPDEKVLPLLEKYNNDKNIILLKNEENLGFVGTVNKGMKYSKNNDVLLLNSDTEVTSNWLLNIQKIAYENERVATVTPLSNNATLVSIPKGLEKNELKEGFSVEDYSKLVQKTAYNEVIELPTAHGFCMFIKREVLDLVGFFDEESFGKGYGEENDFSFRCLDYGYRNILCPNAYVFHKESQSFSSKREKLVNEHEKILEERYPLYKQRVGYWLESFPIKKICENIFYEQEMYNRKNILLVIHDWSNINENVGGTTLHVLDLINNLRDKYNFHVLAPENGIYKLRSYFKNSEKELFFDGISSTNIIPLYNNKYKKMIEDIVTAFRIDTIHIHHMIGHCFDIIDVAKENNIYSIITLHDFYSLCPSINMLYMMKDFCLDLENKDCKKCIKSKLNINNNIIDSWRDNWSNFLKKFDKVLVPSNNTKEIISKIFKGIKITSIEHGIDLISNNYYGNIDGVSDFNVAFVGVMTTHKGGQILLDLIKQKYPNIKFHLFGKSEFDELKKNRNNYIFHGQYKRKDLPNLIKDNNIHLVCSFSIWPETYSYTLTECINSGVPVLSFNIGAINERIEKYNIGYTINLTNNEKIILNKITEIFKDRKVYNEKIDAIKKYKIKSTREMADEYVEFYDNNKIISLSEKSTNTLKLLINNNFNVNETLSSAETIAIVNSLRWKVVSKIKIPNRMKKIIKKVMRR